MNKSGQRKVLVIDDSDIIRTYVSDMLRESGYQVYSLPSAIGSSMLILQQSIDVAVVDVSMPGLSGDRLVQLFRKNKNMSKLFIVVMTDRDEAELQKLRETTQADAVISKRHVEKLPRIISPPKIASLGIAR